MSFMVMNSGDFQVSTWLNFFEPEKSASQNLDVQFKSIGTFSPTTSWEKVFQLGDIINRDLKMTEGEIIDAVSILRKKKKGRP